MEKGRSRESLVKTKTLAQVMILKEMAKKAKINRGSTREYCRYTDYGDSSADWC